MGHPSLQMKVRQSPTRCEYLLEGRGQGKNVRFACTNKKPRAQARTEVRGSLKLHGDTLGHHRRWVGWEKQLLGAGGD